MNLWGITDVGAVRKQNQDDYYVELLEPDLGIALVCDGMGGARAGNIASQLAVQIFLETAKASSPQEWRSEPEALLHSAAQRANEVVYTKAGREPECRGMGTTMVVALVVDRTAYILNIGDSRCYLVQPDGIRRVTRDHSVVEDLVTRGKITPEQARQHPQKNLITRALGAESQLRADLYRQDLSPGDALVLCSDGLSNLVSEQEVLYEVLHGGPAEDCCRRLLDIALLRGAPDNVTVVLLQM